MEKVKGRVSIDPPITNVVFESNIKLNILSKWMLNHDFAVNAVSIIFIVSTNYELK